MTSRIAGDGVNGSREEDSGMTSRAAKLLLSSGGGRLAVVPDEWQ